MGYLQYTNSARLTIFIHHSQSQPSPKRNRACLYTGTAQGEGLGGFTPPPTFLLYKIKMKESSNKIAEEISLVRNGVKLQFNVSRHKEQRK